MTISTEIEKNQKRRPFTAIAGRLPAFVFFAILMGTIIWQAAAGYSSSDELMGVQPPLWTQALPSRACPGTSITDCHYASPLVADVDGDEQLDIIVATNQGHVLVVRSDGTILWDRDVAPYFGMAANSQVIASSPAVGDVDADGLAEVIVGAGSIYSDCTQGGVIVLEHDGQAKAGWPALAEDENNNGCRDAIFASPAVGDLDNDGDLEIVAGGFDKRIYAWDDDGTLLPGFPPNSHHLERFPNWNGLVGKLADTVWGSPVLADIDQDGYLDIVIGTDEGNYDSSWPGQSDGWVCPYAAPPGWPHGYCGGSLYVLDRFGQELPGFPKYILEAIQSTPAVADVIGDNHPEIFVGTGTFYYQNSPDHPTAGFRVFGWNHAGQDLPGWEGGKVVGGGVPASPVIGDIAGDSQPEIVVAAADKKLYAWHLNGTAVSGFPMTPTDHNSSSLSTFDVGSSFILADYDGDGKMEILLSEGWAIVAIDGNGQHLTATNWPNDARPIYLTNGTLLNTPAVADLDGDTNLELIASNHELFVWELFGSGSAAQWPLFKLNAQRTGARPQPPQLSVPSPSVVLFVPISGDEQAIGSLLIGNEGGSPLKWSVTAPDGVTLSAAAGTLAAGEQQNLLVAVESASYDTGKYEMGDLLVTATAEDGSIIEGSPAAASLILIVGPYSQTFLPAITR